MCDVKHFLILEYASFFVLMKKLLRVFQFAQMLDIIIYLNCCLADRYYYTHEISYDSFSANLNKFKRRVHVLNKYFNCLFRKEASLVDLEE